MATREEQRESYKKRITDAAKEVFLSEGYQNATTKKIARKAGVGEGTIFNHYKSKSDLLIAIYQSALIEDQDFIIDLDSGRETVDYVSDFFDHYLDKTASIDKEWLCQIFSALYSEKNSLYSSLKSFDDIWIDKFTTLITTLSDRGVVKRVKNIRNFISVTYSVIMNHYSRYAVTPDMTRDEFKKGITDEVLFLINELLL